MKAAGFVNVVALLSLFQLCCRAESHLTVGKCNPQSLRQLISRPLRDRQTRLPGRNNKVEDQWETSQWHSEENSPSLMSTPQEKKPSNQGLEQRQREAQGRRNLRDAEVEAGSSLSETEECDYSTGKWVPRGKSDPSVSYNGTSCSLIRSHENCQKHGRNDTAYLGWRWQPTQPGCTLLMFDPLSFLEMHRNKVIGFCGDSLSVNFEDSIRCQLSSVVPEQVRKLTFPGTSAIGYLYRQYNMTLLHIASSFMVQNEKAKDVKGVWEVHLDRANLHWAGALPYMSLFVFTIGPWYIQSRLDQRRYFIDGKLQRGMGGPAALKIALETVRDTIQGTGFRGAAVLMTNSPTHYKGMPLTKDGNCAGRELPLSLTQEMVADKANKAMQIREIQVSVFRETSVRLLDVTHLSMFRPDGHSQAYTGNAARVDCIHWCLPGVPDTWTDLLFTLLSNGQDRPQKRTSIGSGVLVAESRLKAGSKDSSDELQMGAGLNAAPSPGVSQSPLTEEDASMEEGSLLLADRASRQQKSMASLSEEDASMEEGSLQLSDRSGSQELSPGEELKHRGGVDAGRCDFSLGKWVRKNKTDSQPAYSSHTCGSIRSHENCQRHGRTDTKYLDWKWEPLQPGCGITNFDPLGFLEEHRNQIVGFCGDSLSVNFEDSLRCQLSSVAPERPRKFMLGKTTVVGFMYGNYNFTLLHISSTFMVNATPERDRRDYKAVWEVHLDRPYRQWVGALPYMSLFVFSIGPWYTQAKTDKRRYFIGGKVQEGMEGQDALKLALQTVRETLERSSFRGVPVMVTMTTPHYQGVPGNPRGDCGKRTEPLTVEEERRVEEINPSLKIRDMQVSVFQGMGSGDEGDVRVRLLDITRLSMFRPDAHSQKFNGDIKKVDCIHWCLPGVPDTWVDILYTMLLNEKVSL